MGKKGKKAQAGKPKKLTPKDVGKRLDALVKKLGVELKGADLFAPPTPETEDCPICLVPFSRANMGHVAFWACCGKKVCIGCNGEKDAFLEPGSDPLCPFCRTPLASSKQWLGQMEARAAKNDAYALYNLGSVFLMGTHHQPKDELRALWYYTQATELGSAGACGSISYCYQSGKGVSVNLERSMFFLGAAAFKGNLDCRHNLGRYKYSLLGNHESAIRHWKISAEAGMQRSLDELTNIFKADGQLPGKEHIGQQLLDEVSRACQQAQERVKSEEREKHKGDEIVFKYM